MIREDNPHGLAREALERFRELLLHPAVEWFVVPLPDEFAVAGCSAKRRDCEWFVAPVAGEAGKRLNEEEMLTVSSFDDPVSAVFRHACYANPGGYIVRHCNTLIALWDEKGPIKPSGTAEIVRFQLAGIAPTDYPWTAAVPLGFDGDRGPVIWLNTPRYEDPDPKDPVAKRVVLVSSVAEKMLYGEEITDLPHGKWTGF